MITFFIVMVIGGVVLGVMISVIAAARITYQDRKQLEQIKGELKSMKGKGYTAAQERELASTLVTKAASIRYAPKREEAYKLIELLK